MNKSHSKSLHIKNKLWILLSIYFYPYVLSKVARNWRSMDIQKKFNRCLESKHMFRNKVKHGDMNSLNSDTHIRHIQILC